MMAALWFLYLSFNHIGQLWYGYGWEIQLLETGFLGIFLCPLRETRPFPRMRPPVVVFWLLRWLAFRIYLGAGLIKMRGDHCWRDLTCLLYHYETQPLPNPLSPWFHFLPAWFNKLSVEFTHLIQLIVPVFIFTPRRLRHIAATLLAGFQGLLILSGNLAFLNWLTLVPILACFDDEFWRTLLPRRLGEMADEAESRAAPDQRGVPAASWGLVVLVAWLSVPVVKNLFSPGQIMNTSFNNLHLVNTYGAFGHVGKTRRELIIEGTADKQITSDTKWKAYEFPAKPGDPNRSLPIVSPYHYRLDWQVWFAAMSIPQREPWLMHLVWKLLHNDEGALSLLASNPFPERPPEHIRIEIYRYKFLPPREEGPVWKRERIETWFPAISKRAPGFKEYLQSRGWAK